MPARLATVPPTTRWPLMPYAIIVMLADILLGDRHVFLGEASLGSRQAVVETGRLPGVTFPGILLPVILTGLGVWGLGG
jgi:hypothetical protein